LLSQDGFVILLPQPLSPGITDVCYHTLYQTFAVLELKKTRCFLSPFGLLYQNTLDWVIYKQWVFIAVLEAGKFKIKVPIDVVSSEDSNLYVSSHGKKENKLPWASSRSLL
jgi:hypothetical protein